MTLDPTVLYKMIDDLKDGGAKVIKFDMQGHGEPLLHKKIWEMFRYIADRYPQSINSVCTHANAKFRPEMVESGLNEILFAIDGVDQQSYAPYRVLGSFDRAYEFMKQFSLHSDKVAPHINRVWKYVVFSHNDSNEQLLRAQQLAIEAKVTNLRFVITQLGPVSNRVKDGSEIPILDSSLNVTIDRYRITTQQLNSGLDELKRAASNNDVEMAVHWAEYFAHSAFRLYRTTLDISEQDRAVVESFDKIIGPMQAGKFGKAFAQRMTIEKPANNTHTPTDNMLFMSGANHGNLPPLAASVRVSEYADVIERITVDEEWYLSQYPQVIPYISEGTYANASEHYRISGFFEGYLPYRAPVDPDWYSSKYEDVRLAIESGQEFSAERHFIAHGYREGRLYNAAALPPTPQLPAMPLALNGTPQPRMRLPAMVFGTAFLKRIRSLGFLIREYKTR
ncbi:radical SAM protein [Agrobacterium vitis]|uniref:radical SAM protein n=1 Tax=Agrobacterium vitis TaxID=373 RepID=UPI003D2C5D82